LKVRWLVTALLLAVMLLGLCSVAFAGGTGMWIGSTYYYWDHDTGLSFTGQWIGNHFYGYWSNGVTVMGMKIGNHYYWTTWGRW
jgi:hypothetical protein